MEWKKKKNANTVISSAPTDVIPSLLPPHTAGALKTEKEKNSELRKEQIQQQKAVACALQIAKAITKKTKSR